VTDPLADALAKLERAERQLRVLNRLVQRWERLGKGDKPYALRPQVESTRAEPRPHVVYRFAVDQDPPPSLPMLIGECTHNLRCAVDYVAFALKRDPRPPDEDIQFPIWTDEWHPKSKWLGGLIPTAADAIKGLQPFEGGNRRADRPHDLAILRHLSNWDKHRKLIVQGISQGITSWYGPAPILFHTGPFPHGAIVMEFGVDATTDMGDAVMSHRPYVSTSPDIAAVVAFADPPEVRGLAPSLSLGYIAEYIRDTVIPQLRPFV